MKKNLFQLLLVFFWGMFPAQELQILESSTQQALPKVLYFCENQSINLEVDASATTQTGQYEISKISPKPLSATTPVLFSASNKNLFSRPINLPFPFEFYGKTYHKVVVGANGRLVFTDAQVGGSDLIDLLHQPTAYTDDYISNLNNKIVSEGFNKINLNNPARVEPLASIFAAWSYLQSGSNTGNDTREIYYQALADKFVVYFNQMPFQAGPEKLISQVILYPDGSFDIIVIQKPLYAPEPQVQHALVGIQNQEATQGQWPPNDSHGNAPDFYNNGKWEVQSTDPIAFHFKPQKEVLTPKFTWLRVNGGQVLSTDNPFSLNTGLITDGDKIKAKVAYVNSLGEVVKTEESNEVLFKKMPTLKLSTEDHCNVSAGIKANWLDWPASDYILENFEFQWFKDGNIISGATGMSYEATQSGAYKLVAKSRFFNCSTQDKVNISLNSVLPQFQPLVVEDCDTDFQSNKTYDLATYFPPGDGSQYTVTYKDAEGNTMADTQVVVAAGATLTGTVEVKALGVSCKPTVYTWKISYFSLPEEKTYQSEYLCVGASSYELQSFEDQFAGRGYTFLYSLDGGASYQALSQVNPTEYPSLKVKITASGASCTSEATLHFNFHPEVIAHQPTTQLPWQCPSRTETFDLASLIPEINPSPNVSVSFHESKDDAISGANPVPLNYRTKHIGVTTLYIRVVDNQTGCAAQNIPEITLEVARSPRILVDNPLVIKQCEGNYIYNLSLDVDTLTSDPNKVESVTFYDEYGTLLTQSEIEQYDVQVHGYRPYIEIVYNPTCGATIDFDLQQIPKPTAQKTHFTYCGETHYSLEKWKSEVVAHPEQFIFMDAAGNELTSDFDLTIATSYTVLIKSKNTGCISLPIKVEFVKGNPTPLINKEVQATFCDEEGDYFDGKTTINLTDFETSIAQNAGFSYFLDAAQTQKIAAPEQFKTSQAHTTVYVSVKGMAAGLCPVSAKIELTVNIPTKALGLQPKYNLCYGAYFAPNLTNPADFSKIEWHDASGKIIGSGANFILPYDKVQFGQYSVVFTALNGCSYVEHFMISDENQPHIDKVKTTNNRIEVLASGGQPPYEYSFDGGVTWQNSNILQNPSLPQYEIWVRTKNGCLGAPKTVYFIKVSNLITPNGDGYNDFWEIKNLDKMEQVEMQVSDRYGNMVFRTTDKAHLRWDGKQAGRVLPTGTYWYVVKWVDPLTQEAVVRTGWVMLKNR